MAIVSTMILRSMRMIGEKARGATLDTAEQTETLAEFNTFLDSLATDRLYAVTVQQDSKALSASTSTLTIGTNGSFNVTRPIKLVDPCFIRDANGFDTPLTIITSPQYGRIVDKDAGYTVPSHIYYDSGFSATSTGTLHLYPATSASLTLFINSWRQLGTVSTLSQNLNLPPGYQLFVESNFAIHLAAGLTPVSAETVRLARESKTAIQANNLPEPVMRLDNGLVTRGGNILTGD
jgi:hypothetical protein